MSDMNQVPATTEAPPLASPASVPPDDELGRRVADDLSLPRSGVEAVLKLFADKATVPFIARYRKEATGALDEVQIRAIEERHSYLVELEDRRRTILQTIADQDKLTDALRAKILACAS